MRQNCYSTRSTLWIRGLILLEVRILFECGYRRSLSPAVRVLLRLVCVTTSRGYTSHAGYIQSCSHEGTRHILSEQCHLLVRGKTKTNNIPAPQVYNLRERSCSFVPLTRQRNIASISRGITLLNQAPGDRSIGGPLTAVRWIRLVAFGGLLRHSPGR